MKIDTKDFNPQLSEISGQFRFSYKGVEYSIVDLNFLFVQLPKDIKMANTFRNVGTEVFDGEDVYRFKTPEEAFKKILDGTYKE